MRLIFCVFSESVCHVLINLNRIVKVCFLLAYHLDISWIHFRIAQPYYYYYFSKDFVFLGFFFFLASLLLPHSTIPSNEMQIILIYYLSVIVLRPFGGPQTIVICKLFWVFNHFCPLRSISLSPHWEFTF